MKMPVFVVTGFLDAGKTTFLTQILEEEGFSEEDKTLIIMCEEGEEEYDEKTLSDLNIDVVSVDSQEDFTPEFLADCARIYKPECIFIEYNGMWKTQDLFDMKLPKGWFLNQVVTIVDGSTFDVYLNNMRSLMMDIFSQSELVIFNRCSEDMPLNSYRRSIKAVNRRAQVIFENEDGEMIPLTVDEMPFDVNADVIKVEDEDFGLWYIDALDNKDKYDGKTVEFKGKIYKSKDFPDGYFVPGRHAMTCCADDIRFIGFVCKTTHGDAMKNNHWVDVTAKIRYEYFPAYHGEGPVLYLKHAVSAPKPEEELVYFN
ncbi:MAG TPA: GTPase [Candidatus Scybalocola faecavium]|nr:GTPase [Candidatus Scybalocola faecavium]